MVFVPWANPAFGNGGGLVFTSVHSPDYVAGSTGWTLNKDGSAELNGVTVRGTLESVNYVAGVSGWQLNQGGNAELNNATVRGTIVIDGSGGSQLILENTSGQPSVILVPPGWSPTVYPGLIYASLAGGVGPGAELGFYGPAYSGSTDTATIIATSGNAGNPDAVSIDIDARSSSYPTTGNPGNVHILTQRMIMNGQNVGLGLAIETSSGANSAAIAGVNTVVLTFPSRTYLANTTYKVEFMGRYSCAAVAGRVEAQIRKTNVAGQLLVDFGRTYMDTATPDSYNGYAAGFFTVGTANVTATLVMCIQGLGANAVTQLAGRTATITNWCDDSRYPNATVLV